jgi:hypothetical protein
MGTLRKHPTRPTLPGDTPTPLGKYLTQLAERDERAYDDRGYLEYRKSADQALTTSATTYTVSWDRAITQLGTALAPDTRVASRFTATQPGVYLIDATLAFAANATGSRRAWLELNDTTTKRWGEVCVPAATTDPTVIRLTAILRLADAEYLTVKAVQRSGGALSLLGAAATTECSFQAFLLF